jgi:hypothetical protein
MIPLCLTVQEIWNVQEELKGWNVPTLAELKVVDEPEKGKTQVLYALQKVSPSILSLSLLLYVLISISHSVIDPFGRIRSPRSRHRPHLRGGPQQHFVSHGR